MGNRLLQRTVSFLLVVVLLFAVFPLNQIHAADRTYQEKLEWLFYEHPEEISFEEGTVRTASALYYDAKKVLDEQFRLMGHSRNDYILSVMMGSDSREKEWSYAAAEAFFLDYASSFDFQEQAEAFEDLYNTKDIVEGDIEAVSKWLTKSDIEDIKALVESSEFVSDAIELATDTKLDAVMTYANVTVSAIALYTCEAEAMESLLASLKKTGQTNSGLYLGLLKVKQNLDDPVAYIQKKVTGATGEVLANFLVEAAVTMAAMAVPQVAAVVALIDTSLWISKHLLKIPDAETLAKAAHYAEYYELMLKAMEQIRKELIQNAENNIRDESLVEHYRVLYEAARTSVLKCGQEVLNMRIDNVEELGVENYSEMLKLKCTFEVFVTVCYGRGVERIENAGGEGNYRYHMYVNENGKRFVCPYAGAMQYPGTTFTLTYSEWVDEPLDVDNGSYQYYVHTRTAECEKYGCVDPSWEGFRYVDEDGKTWVCPEIRDESQCIHLWSNGKIKQKASCEDSGIYLFVCALCGKTKEESVPSNGHSFEDGTCVSCGEGRGLIADRLSQLSEKLDGVYFTTTGKSCGNSNCDACAMKNVVKTERINELFDGFVPAESVAISHDYGKNNPFTNGWSCCGFANFAGWYLFAENTKDSVDFNCICPDGKPVAFTEEGLKSADVKPGDLLRLSKDPALGAKGHSAVFVDFTENGILILDCNMRLPGDGYCRIRTHELKYGEIYSYICVSRADNYDQIVEETPEEDGEFKTQYRYHMYVNENGKRFVCPYAGQLSYPGTTFEIQYTQWLDAPLTVDNGSYTHYIHTRTEQCEDYGCQDASWEGNRYRDGDGLTWACQETRKIPVEEKYRWGDANGDGEADYSDALAVLRFSIGLGELSSEAQKACDVDGNPGLNYNDALTILRRSIGLE